MHIFDRSGQNAGGFGILLLAPTRFEDRSAVHRRKAWRRERLLFRMRSFGDNLKY